MSRVSHWTVGLVGVIALGSGRAEGPDASGLRDFVNLNGQAIRAKLVTHKQGKVTMERADGKRFEVNPVQFQVDDQIHILEWMKETPETYLYRFRIEATREKVDGGPVGLASKKVKNERWTYRIKITNALPEVARGLSVQYRVFWMNEADGEFGLEPEDAAVQAAEGQAELPAELPYNLTIEVLTEPVQIDTVEYEGGRTRYKDELEGCLVRMVDSRGVAVADWVTPLATMKERTWDNTGDMVQPTIQPRD